MGRKVGIAAVAVVAAGLVPAGLLLILLAVLALPITTGGCGRDSILRVGPVPASLTARTTDGTPVTLDRKQLARAAAILAVAGRVPTAAHRVARIALMAALTESRLRMLANPTVPDSSGHPHDGLGSDHDSLGLFQMRPSAGWGTVSQLMDATYEAEAFLGGPTGPNRGSPAGLTDIRDWTVLTDGQAAQAVEVSAYPGRYTAWAPVADRIITALTDRGAPSTSASPLETTNVAFPLPDGSWTITARFGPRTDPITGLAGFHHGTDFAARAGTLIRSATDGRVINAGMIAGTGTITVLSTVGGTPTAIVYLHMPADGIDVHPGQVIAVGQIIGAVGSTGHSTGPHLHFQVQPGGVSASAIDSLAWLDAHHATTVKAARAPAACR